MNDQQLVKIYNDLPDSIKKQLDEIDKRILEVQDKPLEYFIEQFKNGKPYQDIDILKLEKLHLFSLYVNDSDSLRRSAIEVWNAFCKKNLQWIDTQNQLRELKNERGMIP